MKYLVQNQPARAVNIIICLISFSTALAPKLAASMTFFRNCVPFAPRLLPSPAKGNHDFELGDQPIIVSLANINAVYIFTVYFSFKFQNHTIFGPKLMYVFKFRVAQHYTGREQILNCQFLPVCGVNTTCGNENRPRVTFPKELLGWDYIQACHLARSLRVIIASRFETYLQS